MSSQFLRTLNDPDGQTSNFLETLKCIGCKGRGGLVLAVGSTETSDLPGVSAAGASGELRRLTPKIDAEILMTGSIADGQSMPVSPAGVVSPVVISRAITNQFDWLVKVVNCGAFVAPKLDCLTVGTEPARCLSTGCALSIDDVDRLFWSGLDLGKQLSEQVDYLILAECVPGGTTTAHGVLRALGFAVDGLLSSSLPQSDHALRSRLVEEGLKRAQLEQDKLRKAPLTAVAAVGDPMQPLVAGITLAAAKKIPVVLGGGSQMLAVWSLIQRLIDLDGFQFSPGSLAVVTTKWVAFDRSAACRQLAQMVGAPFACSLPDFTRSRFAGLRLYEEGHVKEGVGAGAAMALANLIGGFSNEEIMSFVDDMYEDLVFPGKPSEAIHTGSEINARPL